MGSIKTLEGIVSLTEQLKEETAKYLEQVKAEDKYIEHANQIQFDIVHTLENIALTEEEAFKCVNYLREVRVKRRQACLGKKAFDLNEEEINKLCDFLNALMIKDSACYPHYQLRTPEGENIVTELTNASRRASVEFRTLNGEVFKSPEVKEEPKVKVVVDEVEVEEPLTAKEENILNSDAVKNIVQDLCKSVNDKLSKEKKEKTYTMSSGDKVIDTPDGWKNYLVKMGFNPNTVIDGYVPFMSNKVGFKCEKISAPLNLKYGSLALVEKPVELTEYRLTKQNNLWILKDGTKIVVRSSKLDKMINYFNTTTGKFLVSEKYLTPFIKHVVENYTLVNDKLEKLI